MKDCLFTFVIAQGDCRSCSLCSNITSSSLRPCDFKMGKVVNSIQMFRCMYNFNVRLPIFHENASKFQTVSDILRHAISMHAKELKGAEALIDGKLVDDNEQCSSDGVHEVEPLLPFMSNSPVEQKDAAFRFLEGSLHLGWQEFMYVTTCNPLRQLRCQEIIVQLLSVKYPAADSTILEPETEASALRSKSFWDVAVPFGLAIQHLEEKGRIEVIGERSSKSSKPVNINVVARGPTHQCSSLALVLVLPSWC